ncbi:putative signal transducing protein [Altibacter lentus]|uniref:putative signal transducing protein n=1 Tax=Altibacter lentus TaxID=1223410 RepID=UPI00068EF41B|nr:DUF2007 domain-containing protein [Altibacter lentus]
MKTVLLTTCSDNFQAELIKGILDSEDIPCFLVNENFTSLLPMYYNILGSGIQVRVFESDLERAKLYTNLKQKSISCPTCNSDKVTPYLGNWKEKFLVLISLLFFVPFGNVLNRFYCKNCSTEFINNSA